MIVRCPECQTGFNLSPEKVPDKGAKLRCSQCDHVFRVRIRDGRSEIFYKNKAENIPVLDANNETQIGGLHRENPAEPNRETEQLSAVEDGGQTSFGYPSRTGTQPRKKGMVPLIAPRVKALPVRTPILTPPAIDRRLDIDKPPKPIKSPSKRKLTPVPSDELDLFGDDSGFNFSNNDRSVEDPFFGAFDEPEKKSIFATPDDEPDLGDAAMSDYSHEINSWADESPVEENIEIETNSEDFFSRGGSARNYDELAPASTRAEPPSTPASAPPIPDPPLGDTPRQPIEAKRTKKVEPKLQLAIKRKPVQPTRPPASESTSNRPKAKKKREAKEPRPEGPIALKPHKIGGNTFRRIFDTLFIGIFLLGSFVGVIAFKTGGFFDFSAPLHMLEVAFDGKPYEMNPGLNINDENSVNAGPYIENLIAVPYRLKSKNHVLLVNGFINNPGPAEKTSQAVVVEISSTGGEKVQEVHIGEALSFAQLKERLDADSFSTLPNANSLAKESSTPFFVVFRSPVRFRDLAIKTKIISK